MGSARDQIIETTCILLELQGYHATGLNQIIKDCGSPKGSLYYYFPGGKEELTAEALYRVGQIVRERIKANLALVDSPAQAIGNFIRLVAKSIQASNYCTGGPITTVALETTACSERLREECDRIYIGWQAVLFEKLLSGGFSMERSKRLASLIIAALEGGIILCRTNRSPEPLENIAQELEILLSQTK
jgi:TetR/AcrR family transcriptional repressor of lmrAB and yxaGH operons